MTAGLVRVMRRASHAMALLAVSACAVSASADPIVGTWVGTGSHTGADDQFNMRLTFVSPKGGVSRYPDIPCGGKLVGGPSGDDKYQYDETILYNGPMSGATITASTVACGCRSTATK